MIANFSQQATKVKILIDFPEECIELIITFFTTEKPAAPRQKYKIAAIPGHHLASYSFNLSALSFQTLKLYSFKLNRSISREQSEATHRR
jgi:hypothetical protein